MTRFKRFLTGKTKAGQVFYGIVDALPIPNLLNPIRSAIDTTPHAKISELSKVAWDKVDKIRLAMGVVVSYLIISGKVSTDTINDLLDVLLRIF